MADRVRKVSYCYVMVPNRAGQGARILGALREAGVNLLAYTGFPAKGGKAQLDFVTDDMAGLKRVARSGGWRLSKTKRGFLIQGDDKAGAAFRHLARLAGANRYRRLGHRYDFRNCRGRAADEIPRRSGEQRQRIADGAVALFAPPELLR